MNTLILVFAGLFVLASAAFVWAFMGWQKAKGALDAAVAARWRRQTPTRSR